MPRLSVVIVAFAVAAVMAMPAEAQWKWRTKDGKTQYSDLPPPAEVQDSDILQRPAVTRRTATVLPVPASASAASQTTATAASSPLAPKGVDPRLEAERKKTEDAEAEKKKAEDTKVAAARADNCTRARNYQKTLDDGLRIARTNAKGEREILDDKQRAEESRRTKSIVDSDCKP